MIRPIVVQYCYSRIRGRNLSFFSVDDVVQGVCGLDATSCPTESSQTQDPHRGHGRTNSTCSHHDHCQSFLLALRRVL
jgi:hypothetical protein